MIKKSFSLKKTIVENIEFYILIRAKYLLTKILGPLDYQFKLDTIENTIL